MPRDRFFIVGVHAAGERVALAPDDARKLLTVLRRQTGDPVHVVDGEGAAFAAHLEVDGKAVHAVLDMPLPRGESESGARIVLAQAIPKGQKMDFIVEKATELGVAAIVPLRSTRVAGDRTGEHKQQRWQRIAKTAAQQSGRTQVPTVEAAVDWDALRATFAAYDRVYMPWESAAARPLRERFEAEARSASAILIIVGPEGGFSDDEVAFAQAAGAVPLSLGARILRTETAALTVLAALLYARGEL
jgi:16S rRNA (uracil1498-N3)-methyltransferase